MVCIEVYVCVKKKKKEQKRNVGEAVEELEPSRIAGENVKWCSRCEK